MGSRADESKDGRMPVAEAGARRPVEFIEWTGDNHLRHSKFVGLREDKKATNVVRE